MTEPKTLEEAWAKFEDGWGSTRGRLRDAVRALALAVLEEAANEHRTVLPGSVSNVAQCVQCQAIRRRIEELGK